MIVEKMFGIGGGQICIVFFVDLCGYGVIDVEYCDVVLVVVGLQCFEDGVVNEFDFVQGDVFEGKGLVCG